MTSSIFWQVTRLSIQRQFSYRAATLAGLATNLFLGILRDTLIAALPHDPQQLFLDEIIIVLDVVAKEHIRKFILHFHYSRGVTVILTTNDLTDVEKLYEQAMIIDHGKLLYDGDLELLREQFGDKRQLVVQFSESYPDASISGASVIQVIDG